MRHRKASSTIGTRKRWQYDPSRRVQLPYRRTYGTVQVHFDTEEEWCKGSTRNLPQSRVKKKKLSQLAVYNRSIYTRTYTPSFKPSSTSPNEKASPEKLQYSLKYLCVYRIPIVAYFRLRWRGSGTINRHCNPNTTNPNI